MRYLITGGSGFLGINLIRHLLKNGAQVRSLDIADFAYPERSTIDVQTGDIRDRETVQRIMSNIDIVVHTAAALPLYSRKEIFDTEVQGTKNLLDAAQQNNIKRFIHISSTAVYGIPRHHPIDENDPLQGVGPYGQAKIDAENLCLTARKNGFCVSILRPKSFIGPERLGVFSLLFDWARTGHGFPVLGSGANRYQLLDVEDLCLAIETCATADYHAVNDTFNIGAKRFTTIREDFQSVLDLAGFGKKIRPIPAWPAKVALRIAESFHASPLYGWVYDTVDKDSFVSIQKAERILGFSPSYSNKEALKRNYQWYCENYATFAGTSGVSHRVPWSQGLLQLAKVFF